MAKAKVPRKGGLVSRGKSLHLRRDHATTVEKRGEPAKTGRQHHNQLQLGAKSLAGDGDRAFSEARPPKPLGAFSSNVYDILISFKKRKNIHALKGKGVARFKTFLLGNQVQRVGPNSLIESPRGLSHGDLSRFNLSGSTFTAESLTNFDFSDSSLDESVFRRNENSFSVAMLMQSPVFRGASMRDVKFDGVNFQGYCDFRDADVQGMVMRDVDFFSGVELDFRGSNISSQQLDYIIDNMPVQMSHHGWTPVHGDRYKVSYDRCTLEEVVELTGIDSETIGVFIWSGYIEIRERDSHRVVDPSNFNSGSHVIPKWEIQKLLQGSSGDTE